MIVQTVLDVQTVFENTWGYIGLPYPEILVNRFLKGKKSLPEFKFDKKYVKRSELKLRSDLAAPLRYADIFLPIWLFEADNTSDEDKYLLPLSMMRMTCKKNIVATPLVNGAGTVKEEISIDDWELDIKGVMVGLDGDYPDAELQTLAGWWERSAALNIQNAKTAICMSGGEKALITSLNLPECNGFENIQPYELKMISDVPFSLNII
jgi:hypothetical protein